MIFWLIVGATLLLVAGVSARALMSPGSTVAPAACDLQVYRDQLKDVERDLARGVISEADAERAGVEISRRVLAADRALQQAESTSHPAPRWASTALITGLLIVGSGSAVLLYRYLGAPGYPDQPYAARIAMLDQLRAHRPDQAQAEAQAPARQAPKASPAYLKLLAKLRAVVKKRPDDPQGFYYLARSEVSLGNFKRAYEAQKRYLQIKGKAATGADWSSYGEMLTMAAGGYVSPVAEAALREALKRAPKDPVARYDAGVMFAQGGRFDLAFQLWEPLLREGPANAPWIAPIRAQISEVAARAGVRYTLPPVTASAAPAGPKLATPPANKSTATAGPGASDVANAAQLSAADRGKLIQSMVARLAKRLASQGGSGEEWAKLIRAYEVLGETDKAASTWNSAKKALAATPLELAKAAAAAKAANLSK